MDRKSHLLVSIKNMPDKIEIKCLTPRNINRLISFTGIVVRTSDVYPEMKEGAFRCILCQHEEFVELSNARVAEPRQCQRCMQRNTMEIVHNLCRFTDKQYVKFQELP
ncbi:unnamed protein product [Sphagnum balticum]